MRRQQGFCDLPALLGDFLKQASECSTKQGVPGRRLPNPLPEIGRLKGPHEAISVSFRGAVPACPFKAHKQGRFNQLAM
jgi:hypothetical protein